MDGRGPLIYGFNAATIRAVARRLHGQAGTLDLRHFEDGEHKCRPLDNVRDRDVYLLDSLQGDHEASVNDRLVRCCLLLGALRDAGAGRLTAVLPYLCYSRKDRRSKRQDPVSTRHVAAMLESCGVERVITLEVHNQAAFENAFRVPAESLSAASLLIHHLRDWIGTEDCLVLSPDTGGLKRVEHFRWMLEKITGRPVDTGCMEKYRSGGKLSGERLMASVGGKQVIMVDDLIASGGTLARAAVACHREGARGIVAIATHGLFTRDAPERLAEAPIDRILVTDSVSQTETTRRKAWRNLYIVPLAPLLADAIQCLHRGGSLWHLGMQMADEADEHALGGMMAGWQWPGHQLPTTPEQRAR